MIISLPGHGKHIAEGLHRLGKSPTCRHLTCCPMPQALPLLFYLNLSVPLSFHASDSPCEPNPGGRERVQREEGTGPCSLACEKRDPQDKKSRQSKKKKKMHVS